MYLLVQYGSVLQAMLDCGNIVLLILGEWRHRLTVTILGLRVSVTNFADHRQCFNV